MKLARVLAVYFLTVSAFAQAPTTALAPPTLERLCGKLRHVEYQLGIQKNLRKVIVNLYPAVRAGECCEAGPPIATAITGRWGSFHLKTKGLAAGSYWLEVQPNGRKYHMLVRYTPKRYPDQLCYQTYWDVHDDGSFGEGGVVTVD